MTHIFELLERIRTEVPFEDMLWAAYSIIGILIIKNAMKRITDTVTVKGALCRILLFSVIYTAFELFSLYMLVPDLVMRVFSV